MDGDDYTYEKPSGGAVLKHRDDMAAAWSALQAVPGTADAWAERWQRQGQRAAGTTLEALAELREQFGAEFDRIWPNGLEGPAIMTYRPDLRTADQVARDEAAELRRRVAELEATVALLLAVVEASVIAS